MVGVLEGFCMVYCGGMECRERVKKRELKRMGDAFLMGFFLLSTTLLSHCRVYSNIWYVVS